VKGAAGIAFALTGVAILALLNKNSSGGSADSTTGAGGSAFPSVGLTNPQIAMLANAIARAEGFGVAGAVPTRANNPGDLALGDVGHGLANSAGVTIFATATDGWNALYNQLLRIFGEASHVYSFEMTFSEMAVKWTGGDNPAAWAANVADALGVTPDTTLVAWINGAI
jgi:hypothetical protein